VLAGTVGEVVYLQLKVLHEQGTGAIAPEDLFSELPQGEERTLVAAMLTDQSGDGIGEEAGGLLEEIVAWLERERLKKRSEDLMKLIKEAEMSGDFSKLNELMLEKTAVDRDLKRPGPVGGSG